jgi:excisionase family DNA binding protein
MNRVTIAEAAKAAGLSTRTIHNMLNDGRLTRYKLAGGRSVRVDLDELHDLFRAE